MTAFSSCTYSISYKLGSTEAMQDGRAYGGTVIKATYRFYRISLTADQPYILTISATPTFGTVALFVISSSTTTSIGHAGPGQTVQPESEGGFYDVASNTFETSPVIVIQPRRSVVLFHGGCWQLHVLDFGAGYEHWHAGRQLHHHGEDQPYRHRRRTAEWRVDGRIPRCGTV